MCGRYVLSLRSGQLRRVLEQNGLPMRRGRDYWEEDEHENDEHEAEEQESEENAFRPSYNLAPGARGLVLLPADAGFELHVMTWGLVPPSAHPGAWDAYKTFNCRADSLCAGKSPWSAVRQNRCIVVASGFYEWLPKADGRVRVPHHVRRADGRPLLLAGLYAPANRTYTIVTTDANAGLAFLHTRMPVVLGYDRDVLDRWLAPGPWSAGHAALLRPWPHIAADDDQRLLVDVVGPGVNKVGRSSPTFIVPVASDDNKQSIARFFGTKRKAGADTDTVDKDKAGDAMVETKKRKVDETDIGPAQADKAEHSPTRKEPTRIETTRKETPTRKEPTRKEMQTTLSLAPRKGRHSPSAAPKNTQAQPSAAAKNTPAQPSAAAKNTPARARPTRGPIDAFFGTT